MVINDVQVLMGCQFIYFNLLLGMGMNLRKNYHRINYYLQVEQQEQLEIYKSWLILNLFWLILIV